MTYIQIDRKYLKEIKKYLTLSDKEFKAAQVELRKSKTLVDIVKNVNKLVNLREESSVILRLLIKTLEFSEKAQSSKK